MSITNGSAILDVVLSTLFLSYVAFALTAVARRRCVIGTQRRYVLASIQWALLVPAIGWFLSATILFAIDGAYALLVFGIPAVLAFDEDVLRLLRDGDDNWFKRTGTRLRRRVIHQMRRLHPAPVATSA